MKKKKKKPVKKVVKKSLLTKSGEGDRPEKPPANG